MFHSFHCLIQNLECEGICDHQINFLQFLKDYDKSNFYIFKLCFPFFACQSFKDKFAHLNICFLVYISKCKLIIVNFLECLGLNVSQKEYYRRKLRANVMRDIFVILSHSGFCLLFRD